MRNDITAGIVTYNSADEIGIVLGSLEGKLPLEHIYVVDNASKDDTVKIIKEDFPKINLIENKENTGFGAGHNVAIRQVESKYHIIINPDIEVKGEVIDELAAFMDENPDIVCACPKILNVDGTEQHLPKYDPKLKYLFGGHFENKLKTAKKWRAEFTRINEELTEVTDVDHCTGCFMFARTDILKKVGGFDERYFLYFEDADLTRMLRKHGRAVYFPYSSVVHKWKRDNNGKNTKIAIRSMIKYFLKWGY